ncbi:kinase-like domain-containing protein [Mycena latifolia]|nr:kinase-like domain-containing protein [Mycena latifolia]
MAKLAEGNDSKIFLLTFDNGSELIAKVPTPIAGHPHLSTASEVATMDYARTILNVPVPRVISWCSRAETTEVGAEYILMERASGEELHMSWAYPGRKRWAKVLEQIVAMQKDMGSHVFSQLGNIYYTEDVAPHLRERPLYAPGTQHIPGSERFKIGPLVNRHVFPAGRILPEADLGPFPDAVSYFSALVRIEQRRLQRERAPCDPFVINPEDNVPSRHIEVLDDLLKLIPALLPPLALQVPAIWHADLNPGNIFLSTGISPSVTSIIDWRDISALPYFMQAALPRPAFLTQPIDERIIVRGPKEAPKPPEDMKTLPLADQEDIKLSMRYCVLQKHFDLLYHHNNEMYKTLIEIPYIADVQQAFEFSTHTWFYGLRSIRRPLILLQRR